MCQGQSMWISKSSNRTFNCKIFNKGVTDKDAATQCDICQFWIYGKCNKLDYIDSMENTIIDAVFVNLFFISF